MRGTAGTAPSGAPRAVSKLSLCDLQAAQSGGHKTLLYGHAILLRHSFSSMVRLTRAVTAASVATSETDQMGGERNVTAVWGVNRLMVCDGPVLCVLNPVPGLFEDVQVADG